MIAEAVRCCRGEGVRPETARAFACALDLRYAGQYHEVTVDAARTMSRAGMDVAVIGRLFHAARITGSTATTSATPEHRSN